MSNFGPEYTDITFNDKRYNYKLHLLEECGKISCTVWYLDNVSLCLCSCLHFSIFFIGVFLLKSSYILAVPPVKWKGNIIM